MKYFDVALGLTALLASSVLHANASSLAKRFSAGVSCPDVVGTFIVSQEGLYPENADFDSHSCLLYIG